MDESQRLDQALSRLRIIDLVAVATADQAGQPWNTPVFAAHDSQLVFYWASHPQARHSQNVVATGRAFLALYDSLGGQGGGLYLEAAAGVVAGASRVAAALDVLGERRGRTFPLAKFLAEESTQRVYWARPEAAWVNRSERDAEGDFIRDHRYVVPLDELRRRLQMI